MMNQPQLNSTTFREAFRGYLLAQQARKVVPRIPVDRLDFKFVLYTGR